MKFTLAGSPSALRKRFIRPDRIKDYEPRENKYGTQDISNFKDEDWVKFLQYIMKLDPKFDNPVTRRKLSQHQHNIQFGVTRRK
jgi:hypothetical protein